MVTLTEDEKRMVFQLEGGRRYDAVQEIGVFCQYTHDHNRRDTAENLLKKFCELSEDDCKALICDIQRNYCLPWKAKSIGRDDRCGKAGIRRPETGRA